MSRDQDSCAKLREVQFLKREKKWVPYPEVDDYALYTTGVPGPLGGDVIFSRTGTDATLSDNLASLHHPLPQKSTSPCERKKKTRRGRLVKVGAKRSEDRMQNKKGRGKNINKKNGQQSEIMETDEREREREQKKTKFQ